MQLLKKNMRINYHGKPALIRTTDEEFIILKIESAGSKVVSLIDYYQEAKDGLITSYEPSLALVKPSRALTSEKAEQLQKYKDYIAPLLEEESPCALRVRKRIIDEVSRKRGDKGKNIPSPSTLYNWYSNFVSEEVNRNYLNLILPSNVKRGRDITPEIFDLFYSVIDEWFLKPISEGALNREKTFNKFKVAFSLYKSALPPLEQEKTKLFSRTVFYELISEISPFEVMLERQGYSAALQRFRFTKGVFAAQRPLERVQIDAVHINIALTDNEGNYVGMPVVFFAICIFTRAILGYVISIAKKRREDLSSAIDTVKNALLPKPKPEHTKYNWPLSGLIESIQFDSGIFSSQTFINFLLNLGIEGIQNAAKRPWRNAYIERFNRTFRDQCCFDIPGYADKRAEGKDSSEIQMLPYTTQEEFKKIIDSYILDIYHQQPHRGLGGKSPAQMCEAHKGSVTLMPPELIASIDNYLGIKTHGTIQGHKGIQKNHHFYHSERLREYYVSLYNKHKGGNPSVTYYYSENDISKISVLDEKTGELFSVPALTLNEPISLAEDTARRKGNDTFEKPITFDSMTSIIDGIKDRVKAEKAAKAEKHKKRQQNKKEQTPTLSDAELSELVKKAPTPVCASQQENQIADATKVTAIASRSRTKIVSKINV